jgi:hypothetical protein
VTPDGDLAAINVPVFCCPSFSLPLVLFNNSSLCVSVWWYFSLPTGSAVGCGRSRFATRCRSLVLPAISDEFVRFGWILCCGCWILWCIACYVRPSQGRMDEMYCR